MPLHFPWWGWLVFGLLVIVLLAIDLWAHDKETTHKEALVWSGVWIGAGLAFAVFVWVTFGQQAAGEYLGAYLIEKSLSVDNLFVFLVIFASLGVEQKYQHKVLFWGILGAIVTRGLRRPFQVDGGMDRLLEAYERAGGAEVKRAHVHLHELALAARWCRQALSEGPSAAAHQLQFLRSLLRRVSASSS